MRPSLTILRNVQRLGGGLKQLSAQVDRLTCFIFFRRKKAPCGAVIRRRWAHSSGRAYRRAGGLCGSCALLLYAVLGE